jgi:protein ImuB
MKTRSAKPRTADLFAAADASPAPVPESSPRQREASRSWRAGGVPPTPQTAGHARPKQLWYAVVFPALVDGEHSTAVLQRLCLHAQQFTSFVSVELPNALLLEIKGSVKLFGSLEALHAGIDACWRDLALPAHSATAPSTLAALWLARGRPSAGHPVAIEDLRTLPGHLAKLPIACTAWDIERLQTLRAMGVTRMGELLRLPRAGLVRRLGAATVQDLDIALARQFAPRRAFVPRERFRARCDFETEIENAAYLEKALEPLIARCAQFLRERQAGVQALRLKLRHRAGPATRVHVGLASITSERRRLTDVLAQKLGRLELEAPVRGMELISGSLQPLSAGSLDVFAGLAGGGGRDTAPQLVERLRARLGEDAVYGVASIPEHRPEAAWRRVHELSPATASRMGEKMIDRGTGDGMPRPVWLLDAPLAVSEPDMQERHQRGLVLEQGPERIESGWWDGRGVARDYYVARQPHGAKLWIFQERQSKRWYLHGVFA